MISMSAIEIWNKVRNIEHKAKLDYLAKLRLEIAIKETEKELKQWTFGLQ